MARNYSLNLGEETLKGMTEKARAGIYPSCAPVGYQNADGTNGKRTIIPDPNTAPVITELFERFVPGRHSVKTLVKELKARALRCAVASCIAAMSTIFFESAFTVAISIGTAPHTRVRTKPW